MTIYICEADSSVLSPVRVRVFCQYARRWKHPPGGRQKPERRREGVRKRVEEGRLVKEKEGRGRD